MWHRMKHCLLLINWSRAQQDLSRKKLYGVKQLSVECSKLYDLLQTFILKNWARAQFTNLELISTKKMDPGNCMLNVLNWITCFKLMKRLFFWKIWPVHNWTITLKKEQIKCLILQIISLAPNLAKRHFWCLVYVLSVVFFCATRETGQQLKVLLLKATWQALKNLKMRSSIERNQKQKLLHY